MMNWSCLPAISFGSPPAAAIASNALRIGVGKLSAPKFCAPVARGELSVVVMARPRLSRKHEYTIAALQGRKIPGHPRTEARLHGLCVRRGPRVGSATPNATG